ncbi:MAG: AbiV family abortive infection protein [Deltaproteobacteria bacterium]|nr:AbiV family abortive infection protein [Deltaproteobacteria bacterium]
MPEIKDRFTKSAKLCLENSQRLLNEAELLEFEDPPSTRYFLSMIAQEECAKGFMLFLVSIKVIPWNPLIFRATRDHRCKQLLCVVIDFLTDDNEFINRINSFILENKRLDIPARVNDSMFILRHEKIGRWESNTWVWAEDPSYEETALSVSEGRQDRVKQRSLYVELGKTGEVHATPKEITQEQANTEYEKGRRFTSFLKDLVSGEIPTSVDYENVEQGFRALFSKYVENA